MKRFTGKGEFLSWEKGAKLQVESPQLLTIRSEQDCLVFASDEHDFSDEILVGHAFGEQQVDAQRGYIRCVSKGRVWLAVRIANQTVLWGDEVFTTLDRPEPLSPEMAALQRFVKQNTLEREHDRAEIKALRLRQSQPNPTPAPDAPDPKAKTVADDATRNDAKPQKPKGDAVDKKSVSKAGDDGASDPLPDPPAGDE